MGRFQGHLVIHPDGDNINELRGIAVTRYLDVTLEGTRHGDDRLRGTQEGKRQEDYRNIIKDCHDVSDVSQKITDKESGNWDGTCLHPNPQPRTHDNTLHDIACACPSYSSMGRVLYSIGRSEENTDIHQDGDTVGIRDKLHRYLANHSVDVTMGEARYGSDRFHEVETIPKENILVDYSSVWANTFTLGVKCLWHPHPQPKPETHDRLLDNSCAHSSDGSIE